ncbi:putative co/zn/cd efflux system membrane fusion protein [hydrocarbon metagenome]|uniref:Putative co/zn/cd efflux system membrane fusion protein n=1 Tax=hydrocarbon metagenome TaxID=938273 RepID=A0A0W8G1J1_9ZZZZ
MLRLTKIILLSAVLTFLVSCTHDHDHETEEGHEHGAISVTQYTDSTEIFMEYQPLLVNKETEFLIHLTDLKNFKAVTEGVLTAEFVNENRNKITVTEYEPARAGIYIPSVIFDNAGNYKMTITLKGGQVSDVIIVEDVKVYANSSELPHIHEEESSDISFLKEQQWKIEFANEPVQKRKLQKSVLATGEIKPKPENYAKVVSPVRGTILAKHNSKINSIGDYVKTGEVLLIISPSADASINVQRIKSEYLLAETEYQRVNNLFDRKAVSQKRLDEARSDFEAKRSSYNSLTDQIKITDNGYAILSPINGYIEKLNFSLGENLESGEKLFTIVNPNRLILQANIPSSRSEDVINSNDASFRVEGLNKEYSIKELNGGKISVAAGLNQTNRTISVYYEFNNPQNKIKIGMFAEVFMKIGEGEELLAIPESAIINEDGLHTAYVQLEGEAFEKRILKTGIIDQGYVQVLEGLKEGERVVTKGAYQVRLAALSPESAIGHGHVH